MSYIRRISVKSILAKVYGTIKPGNSDWVNQAIEDTGWAIQAIGVAPGYVQKSTNPKSPEIVRGHRASPPCDCLELLYIERLKEGLDGTTNQMDAEGKNITPESTDCSTKRGVKLTKGTDITAASLSSDRPRTSHQRPSDEDYYVPNGNYIHFGFEEGEVLFTYVGLHTDDDGLPLIIDTFEYKTCIFWYIVSQMLLQGYKIEGMTFNEAWNRFDDFTIKAANSVKMPGIDDMETFENVWKRFSSTRFSYSNFDMNLEQPELIDF